MRVNREALELARGAGDGEAEARVLWNMQQHAYFSGRAREAVAYSKQALVLAERLGLRELCAYVLNDSSRALMSVESVPNALKALAEARVIWRETQNLPMLVDNLSSTAETSVVGGDIETAERFIDESQQLSQTIGNAWNLTYSSGTLMQISALRGETRRGLELHTYIVQLARQSGFVVSEQIADIQRAMILGALGEPTRGIEILRAQPINDAFLFLAPWRVGSMTFLELMRGDLPAARAALAQIQVGASSEDLSTYGPMYLALCNAQFALAEKRFEDALTAARPMVEQMRALGVYYFLPELVWSLAQAHLGLREWDAAEKFLREAEALARHMRARFVLWEILAAMSEMETRRGDLERANVLKNEAREIIEWLADAAPEELRETFLAQEKIRAVGKGLPTDWESG